MKIYAAVILAFSQIHPKTPETGDYIQGYPVVIPAEDIDSAAKIAKFQGLQNWPIAEGWYGHRAKVEPVPDDFVRVAHMGGSYGSGRR